MSPSWRARRRRLAPATVLLLPFCLLLSSALESNAAPSPSDTAAWAAASRGAEAVYVTVWSARGVAGCRGSRGRLEAPAVDEVRAALRDAREEAEISGAGPLRRARACFLSRGAGAAEGAPFDPARQALLVERGARTAVILPGEARTAAYAWRKAHARVGGGASVPRARIFDVTVVDFTAGDLARWKETNP